MRGKFHTASESASNGSASAGNGANGPVAKLNPWHEQIVDIMLMHPDWSQRQRADFFGVTQSWLSRIETSDIFQAYREGRFRAHHAQVSDTVIDRVENLAKLSLDVMHERIEQERAEIPLPVVKETAEMVLKSLGFGVKSSGNAAAAVSVNIDSSLLAEARTRMRETHFEIKQEVQPPLTELDRSESLSSAQTLAFTAVPQVAEELTEHEPSSAYSHAELSPPPRPQAPSASPDESSLGGVQRGHARAFEHAIVEED